MMVTKKVKVIGTACQTQHTHTHTGNQFFSVSLLAMTREPTDT